MNSLILLNLVFTAVAADPAPAAPQNAPAPPAAQAQKEGGEKMEAFEDRTLTVIGHVIHKDGMFMLRIKSFGNAAADAAAEKGKDAKEGKEAKEAKGAAEAGKAHKPRQPHVLKLDEEIRLLRCSTLEDLEEEVGLKQVEVKGEEDVERSPVVQVSGLLTMYRGQPYIFLQHFKSGKDVAPVEKKTGESKKS